MKLLRKLIVIIVLIAALVFVYRHYRKDISEFLLSKGIEIPGITDTVEVFPTSETIIDENGDTAIVVSLPSQYTRSITQDHIDMMIAGSDGRLTAVREADGSISFTVSEDYEDEILAQMNSYYDESVLNNLIAGKVTGIEHNDDYTVFTVTCESGMTESEILTLTGKLFAVGKLYASFSGRDRANICVILVDSEDSSVTNTYTSDNIAQGVASDAQNWAGDMFDQAMTNVAEAVGI